MKPIALREYHVFLASPRDMNSERQEVRKFFESYNRHTAAHWKVRFAVIDYENYASTGVGRPQDLINTQTLEKFRSSLALVIGIMGQRFGSPTGTHESGSEEEFERALVLHQANGYPEIKWFFQTIEIFRAPSDCTEIELALDQWKRVQAFRRRLEGNDPPIYYGVFSDTSDFREKLREDLSLWLYDEKRAWHIGRKRVELPTLIDFPDEYYESIVSNFESLDIGGIDNDQVVDIPLSDVYVRLRVIRDEESEVETEESDEGLMDIHAALGSYSRLVIVGDPGSGKSTFLKFIALIVARAHLTNSPGLATTKLNLTPPLPIPFFISLWDLFDYINRTNDLSQNAIVNFLQSRLLEQGLAISTESLRETLNSGMGCLLFDGLDEVPTQDGRIVVSRLVESFVANFSKNRYVVTSRVRGYSGEAILKRDFVRCDIQDFDESDRAEFLKNWFSALFRLNREAVTDEGTPSKFEYEILRSSIETNDRIRALAVNPLLMTVIAIVHGNRKRLPDQRVVLYDECIDVLLGQRKDAERGIRQSEPAVTDSHFYDRTWTRKRFSEIALRILESGSDEMTRDHIVRLLVPRFLDRGARDESQAVQDAIDFLDKQELQSGLLVSRRSQSFRFVHLTFQEYLAAWNLANQSAENIELAIERNLRDPQWFETLQLLGGELARNSDERLDRYISYLLGSLGARILHQAPVIALCANILRDVRGIAEITAETKKSYTSALRGTLAAFNPGSFVSPNTQLEVLWALAQLGPSVKDHLIKATRSAYYQVRCQALTMLIPFLKDDELFGMEYLINDRSQETITIFLTELFKRDKVRAMSFLMSKTQLNSKASRAILRVLHSSLNFTADDVMDIGMKSFELFDLYDSYILGISRYLSGVKIVRDRFLQALIGIVETSDLRLVRHKALYLIGQLFPPTDQTVALIRRIALDDGEVSYIRNCAFDAAARSAASFNMPILELMEMLTDKKQAATHVSIVTFLGGSYRDDPTVIAAFQRLCRESGSESVRRTAFSYLVKNLALDSLTAKIVLSRDLDGREPFLDPRTPIDQNWVSRCSKRVKLDEADVWELFQELAESLPMELQRVPNN